MKKGDTLWKISKDFNLTLDQLLLANSHLKNLNHTKAGDIIRIPKLKVEVEKEVQQEVKKEVNREIKKVTRNSQLHLPRIHIVKTGDTIESIASTFDISLNYLLEVNPQIQSPFEISVKDKIFIPKRKIGAEYIEALPKVCPHCGGKLGE